MSDTKRKGRHLTEDDEGKFYASLPNRCCGLCRYFSEIEPPTYGDEKRTISLVNLSGHCRVNPPTLLDSDELGEPMRGRWPFVDHDDWCGRFEPHDTTARAQ